MGRFTFVLLLATISLLLADNNFEDDRSPQSESDDYDDPNQSVHNDDQKMCSRADVRFRKFIVRAGLLTEISCEDLCAADALVFRTELAESRLWTGYDSDTGTEFCNYGYACVYYYGFDLGPIFPDYASFDGAESSQRQGSQARLNAARNQHPTSEFAALTFFGLLSAVYRSGKDWFRAQERVYAHFAESPAFQRFNDQFLRAFFRQTDAGVPKNALKHPKSACICDLSVILEAAVSSGSAFCQQSWDFLNGMGGFETRSVHWISEDDRLCATVEDVPGRICVPSTTKEPTEVKDKDRTMVWQTLPMLRRFQSDDIMEAELAAAMAQMNL